MKLTALCIALAMLCMVMEGCDRYTGSDDSYGQKVERGLEKTNQTILDRGDRSGFTTNDAGKTNEFVKTAVAALSDTGWIKTSAHWGAGSDRLR